MKNFKKILSVLMVILLVTTAVPLSSFVGLELPEFDWGMKASALAESGQCGNNVYWTYDSTTGEVIISGEGDMYGYYDSFSPFKYSDIKTVVIEDGVTSIGYDAFYDCDSITSVIISDSVRTINEYAFYSCTGLSNVIIPKGVTHVHRDAFSWCSSLTKVTILASSLNYIAEDAFDFCYNINTVSLDMSSMPSCLKKSSVKTVEILDGTTEIAKFGFSDLSGLSSIIISDRVTTIGNYAFQNCTNLENVSIGKGVTSINGSVFDGCSNIVELKIGAKEIASNAFSGFSSLSKVTFLESVEKICNNAYADCTGLTSITIPNGVTSIGDNAFSGCTYLETINIPDSVTYIGKDILKNTAWFNYRGKGLIILDGWAYGFKGTESGITVDLPADVKGVADRTFTGDSNIVAFKVDNTNPYISSENGVLFNKDKTVLIAYPCGKTASFYTIPDSVKEINGYAFYACNNISNITIGNNVEIIGNYAFYDCDNISALVICDNVEIIGDYAYYGCDNLRNITIGNSVKKIGESAFYYYYSRNVFISDLEAWCNIDFVNEYSNPLNPYYSSYHSYLYIDGGVASDIIIPDTILEIKPYVFYNCISIKNIFIPNSVASIGDYAFCDCDGITNITLPDTVETIGSYAFSGCNYLTNMTLSKNLKSIGNYAFNGSSNIKDLYYPGSQEDWDAVSKGSGNSALTNADLYLMHKHDYTVTVTKQPTCITEGTALYECSLGDSKTVILPALGHTWDEGKITANSTCSKGGTKTYTCTVCFATKSETIETLDHNYQLISSYNPTCTKDGYDVYRCTYCGTTENRTTSPMLGHNFESEFTVDIDSTCTVTGIKSKHCTRCTETAEETVIPLKDHAWQTEPTVTKIPTCTAEGESVVLCRDCKIVKDGSSAVIDALGHDAKNQPFTVDVPATCVSFGKQSRHCTRCNYVEQITRIPMSEHDYYVAEESTATCSKPGVAIYVCRMCKDSFTVENSPALGHDFEYIIIVSPTCMAQGYEIGDCTRCDATDTRPVATIDHDYVRTEVAPTCLEDGLATYTCSYGCGTSYDETLPALGHSYPANWVTILPATCTERGSAIKICRACSEVMSQVMPKLPHTDNDGNGICDICNAGGAHTPNVPDTPVVPDKPDETCDCNCHKGGLMGMLFKLILIFQKFFRMNRVCDCGVEHY